MKNFDIVLKTTFSDDIEAVSALLFASYTRMMVPFYDQAVVDAILPLLTKANERLLRSGNYYAAWTDDQCVGCGGWSMSIPDSDKVNPGISHIRHFATHPDWARKGIGKAILTRCLREAHAQGVKQMDCYSAFGAEPFYAAMGFSKIGVIDVPIPDEMAFPATLMRYEMF